MIVIIIFFSKFNIFSTKIDENQNLIIKDLSMEIMSPEWNFTCKEIETSNYTVATLLMECSKSFKFSIESDYWPGYESYFIESINGFRNGEDNRYWQYYVNGEFGDIGCSSYILHDGDLVEWRFEISKW